MSEGAEDRLVQEGQVLLREARECLQRQDPRGADERLVKARGLLGQLEPVTPVRLEMAAAILSESALLAQRAGDLPRAEQWFGDALRFADHFDLAKWPPRFALLRATVLINLMGVQVRRENFGRAREALQDAESTLRKLPQGDQALHVLSLGLYQNAAHMELQARRPEEARRWLETALEHGKQALEQGATPLLPQVLEVLGRLVRLRASERMDRETEELLHLGLRWAVAQFESDEGASWPQVVSTQLMAAELYFRDDRFSEAEDHLWRAVEVTQDVRPLVQAWAFYLRLLQIPEERRAAGGLPGEEIPDAFEDLAGRLAQSALGEETIGLLEARRRALSEGDPEIADAHLQGLPQEKELSPLDRELAAGLKADAEWLRGAANSS